MAFRQMAPDGTWRGLEETRPEREAESKIRTAQRETSKAMRLEAAERRRAQSTRVNRHLTVSARRAFDAEVDRAGRAFIEAQVPCSDHRAVASRWARAKHAYPYFTAFVVNMIYMAYYAIDRPNDRIDINAQADLDLMTHLLHADAIVSNETGFLRNAFAELWATKGKVIFTPDEFVTYIGKL